MPLIAPSLGIPGITKFSFCFKHIFRANLKCFNFKFVNSFSFLFGNPPIREKCVNKIENNKLHENTLDDEEVQKVVSPSVTVNKFLTT